ncbi:Flp family type IVb pilin [Pedomonas mirosovicensis]|uniref:Flp family type IVb pilin n=1 Tax=Pedomonas mirosovicensis TaxID=2908641 RepID=UPI002168A07F|nr:Flp family type IVb pilin [Pedomonas mirosovicensis]MCH8685787.1 Flp family type IVb pilin [Pedomonas mirosovicensis]
MRNIHHALSRLTRDRSGATAVEYCLLIAIIAIAVAGLISTMGGHPADTFGVIASRIG